MKRLALLALPLLLTGCAAVAVRPEGDLPKPLVVPTPAKVAVVVTNEAANYVHKESRASVDYEAQLGTAHRHIFDEIFRAEFRESKLFPDLDSARKEPGILAIFEPRIEQFSFANAKETGGAYCAVTIRYQIYIYAPDGQQVDMLTLTGYGSGPAPRIGNGEEELAIASYAAMRDAAAKFLTQFPALDVAKPLLVSQALVPKLAPEPGSPEAQAAAEVNAIEALPINETPVVASTSPTTPPAPSTSEKAPSEKPPETPASAPETPPPPSRMTTSRPAAEL
ncbi:MAG TPA: hypothetical protein VM146_10905 [Steroidobacteraceae bacterium]|nr:hypothetical protein [Steroidobacteraceae bacterium]